jgi:hypothetical protein
MITEQDILGELRGLDPARWVEVRDFIVSLKQRAKQAKASKGFAMRDLLNSDLVGMWADREDIGDTLTFARKLRYEAEHRLKTDEDKERRDG